MIFGANSGRGGNVAVVERVAARQYAHERAEGSRGRGIAGVPPTESKCSIRYWAMFLKHQFGNRRGLATA